MTETLAGFTLDSASGMIVPPQGVYEVQGGGFNTANAVARPSRITTARHFATAAAAFTESQAYLAARGTTGTFRGVSMFIASVAPDIQASASSASGGAILSAEWELVAPLRFQP